MEDSSVAEVPRIRALQLFFLVATPGVFWTIHSRLHQVILLSLNKTPSRKSYSLWIMFSSLRRSLPQLGWRWKPLNLSHPDFVRIPEWHKIEEETLPDYTAAEYYPTRIGEIIQDCYQVIGKLGFGSTSTAWLARYME